jgi:putative FmdB family regulatory protein
MPTYEYQCEKCKKTFEVFQSMKDAALTTCPKDACRLKKWGRGKVKRLFGVGAGLIFKGSGFYSTDYRSEGYKAAEKKETPGSTETKTTEPKAPETKASETKASETKKAEAKTHGAAPAPREKPKPPPEKD